MIHNHCAKKRLSEFQEANPNLKLKPKQFVKIKFKQGEDNEWMWVEVKQRDDKKKIFSGILNNDPVKITNWKDGMPVNDISYDKIAQVY